MTRKYLARDTNLERIRREVDAAAAVCPEATSHTPCPEGFVAWHDWADEMARTHKQARCAGCGLYMIWVPGGTIRSPRTRTPILRDQRDTT